MHYPAINMSATGQHIEALVKAHGYSAKDVQEYLGLSAPQAIYKWFRGATLPSIDNLFALSKLFDTPIDQILISEQSEGNANDPRSSQRVNVISNISFAYYCLLAA